MSKSISQRVKTPYSESPRIVVRCDRYDCKHCVGERCTKDSLFLSRTYTELLSKYSKYPSFVKGVVSACIQDYEYNTSTSKINGGSE